MQTVKIGNVEIEKTAMLAPMASVADKAYRTICKEYGAAYVISEMVSVKGLYYSDNKTDELCHISDFERPMAIQLFGDDPLYFKLSVEKINKYTPCIIDINMGCPVPKVAGNGSGSALMKNPALAGKIIAATVSAAKCPVTVKIRSGWDFDNINAVEMAKIAEDNGASAVAVHARTKTQLYSGKADWEIIQRVKNAVNITVIGNGDINSPEDAKRMYDETGCDLVMIGRATYGKPWIFSQVKEYLENGTYTPDPTAEERMKILLHHAELIVENKGERKGMAEARKHAAWYMKGMKNAASFRNRCGEIDSMESLEKLIEEALSE